MFGLEELGLTGLFIGTFLAATILPFSSDALYIAVLLAVKDPVACLVTGSLGNWLGGVTTYWLGRLAKWEWLQKTFKVKPETLQKQKTYIDKYGVWMALLSWVPIIGDVIALALGFYKAPAFWTHVLLLVGKAGRFAIWTAMLTGAL
ncbi:MAG: DedA family protein [Bacteroidales bacterium]|nr:DedA family protein [Bacteroidales bacterium]